MPSREVRSARAAAMAARVRAGLTLTAVGAEMRVHRSTVQRALRGVADVPGVSMGRPRKQVDIVHAMGLRAGGATMTHVALRVGLNRNDLARRLREAAPQ